MHCAHGGEVTFTNAEAGYRLRLFSGHVPDWMKAQAALLAGLTQYAGETVAVTLSRAEVQALMARMADVLAEDAP
jgi:hypothetical protein